MGLLDPQALEYFGLLGQSMLAGQSPNAGVNVGNAMMYADTEMRRKAAEKARLEEERQQAQIRQLAMDRAKREDDFRKALSGGFQPGTAPQQFNDALGDGSGGMIPGRGPSMDFSGAMQVDPLAGFQAQKQWQEMNAKAGPQYKEVNGRLVAVNPDGTVKEVYAAPEKPKFQKGDTRVIKSGRVEITQEWDGSQWKQLAKSAMDKPDATGGPNGLGKPPQGYRWKQDGSGLEPIPGGPADAKVGKEADASVARDAAAAESAKFVISQVGKARDQAKKGWFSTGATGKVMRNIGGTDAFDLNSTVDSIKANIGFDTLAEMRRNSPTGGALGQVAVQELNMLQAARGALDTAQSKEQFLAALDGIEKHYKGWLAAVEQAKRPSGGGASGGWSITRKP